MKHVLVGLYMVLFFPLLAQEKPTNYTDSTGNLYWRKSTPVYLFISDEPDKPKQRLKSKITAQYADPLYLDTEGINYIRSRNAVDPRTMQSIPDKEVMFEIYADGVAPTTSVSYTDDVRFATSETTFYKDGLQIALKAQDRLSGVAQISYKINEAAALAYSKPLVFDQFGTFEVTYFSEDKVGNVEQEQKIMFVIDPTPPYSDLNVNGITENNVISMGTKMYILALDTISGLASVYYKFDNQPYSTYTGGDLPFKLLSEGSHTVTYYSIDKVKNQEAEKSFTFFLDKTAPLMVADVLGDRFIVEDQIYFSGRTKLKLTAVDNKVGVKEIMFSVDDDPFKRYEQPFYLPSVTGTHTIRYYSVDNLNNSTNMGTDKASYIGQGGFEEFKHNVNKVYVDLSGPVISHSITSLYFERSDTLFIGPFTKIKLNGSDADSGLKSLSYSLNNKPEEVEYTAPFTLSAQGYNSLSYFGYDNVNNRNINVFSFYLDDEKPSIFIQFNTGSIEVRNGKSVYPITAGIFLSATDRTSGIKSMSYILDKGPEKPYAGLITSLSKGEHKLTVKAKDFLDNEAVQEVVFYVK